MCIAHTAAVILLSVLLLGNLLALCATAYLGMGISGGVIALTTNAGSFDGPLKQHV